MGDQDGTFIEVEVSGEARSTIVFPLPIDFSNMGSAAHGSSNAAQMQAMMQSAVALASADEQKRLTEQGQTIPDPLARAKAKIGT